jgi:hypothetical protein
MPGLYAHWMDRWERKLATRDTNRVVRPFEWGTDWLHGIGFPSCPAEVNGNAADCVGRFATKLWPIPTASFPTHRSPITACRMGG